MVIIHGHPVNQFTNHQSCVKKKFLKEIKTPCRMEVEHTLHHYHVYIIKLECPSLSVCPWIQQSPCKTSPDKPPPMLTASFSFVRNKLLYKVYAVRQCHSPSGFIVPMYLKQYLYKRLSRQLKTATCKGNS